MAVAGTTRQSSRPAAWQSGSSNLERGINQVARLSTARQLAHGLHLTGAERERFLQAARGEPPLGAALDLHNLRLPLTSFVGRGAEVAQIQSLIAQHQLVTLHGPGGCGKTRLALHAAIDQGAVFPSGIWLVELAPVTSPALVTQAIARVLGLGDQPERNPVIALANGIGKRRLLLLLDNCEHLLATLGPLLTGLLERCPRLHILATSRRPLGLASELVWAVHPLAIPAPPPPAEVTPSLVELSGVPAVALFVNRAQLAQPGFQLTIDNAAAVVTICRRLDGIPLALELAAARLRTLGVADLAAHLDEALALPVTPDLAAPPRQQTLAAALDWSFQLLSAAAW